MKTSELDNVGFGEVDRVENFTPHFDQMAIEYFFDISRNLLLTTWRGRVVGADAVSAYFEIYALAEYAPQMVEIADMSEVTDMEISVDDMRRVIDTRHRLFGASRTKVAVIAPDDLHFGMARMFRAYSELAGAQIVVPFRSRKEATVWAVSPDAR